MGQISWIFVQNWTYSKEIIVFLEFKYRQQWYVPSLQNVPKFQRQFSMTSIIWIFNKKKKFKWTPLLCWHISFSICPIFVDSHTVAIWTFTFHKKSGFVKVILKANFKPVYKPVLWTFWSENSGFLNSFFFYFLQELSNPLLFERCCCYSNNLSCLGCNLMQKSGASISTFLK